MTAYATSASELRIPARSPATPLRRLFDRADLAAPPLAAAGLRIGEDEGVGTRKTLVAFRANCQAVNLWLFTSPGVLGAAEETMTDSSLELRLTGGEADWRNGALVDEVDHGWWSPGTHGPARRWAFSTADCDFVEVLVDGSGEGVFVRMID